MFFVTPKAPFRAKWGVVMILNLYLFNKSEKSVVGKVLDIRDKWVRVEWFDETRRILNPKDSYIDDLLIHHKMIDADGAITMATEAFQEVTGAAVGPHRIELFGLLRNANRILFQVKVNHPLSASLERTDLAKFGFFLVLDENDQIVS